MFFSPFGILGIAEYSLSKNYEQVKHIFRYNRKISKLYPPRSHPFKTFNILDKMNKIGYNKLSHYVF